MAERAFPVDPLNPGHVFACLGSLEVAHMLGKGARGGFEWKDPAATAFRLSWDGERDPVESVLAFLACANVVPCAPVGIDLDPDVPDARRLESFPSAEAQAATLPCLLEDGKAKILLTQWTDGSSREELKHFAGGQSAPFIVREMLSGSADKGTKGVRQLFSMHAGELVSRPFDVMTPLGATFKFDARGSWTALDVGYSPYDQGHSIHASPVVEILAAIGLENARPSKPDPRERRSFRYAVWRGSVPASMARALVAGIDAGRTLRAFRFEQVLSPKWTGKYKVVSYGREEVIA